MIIFAIIMTGISAFFAGIIGGYVSAGFTNKAKHLSIRGEKSPAVISKEYKNFLTYDGSEQA